MQVDRRILFDEVCGRELHRVEWNLQVLGERLRVAALVLQRSAGISHGEGLDVLRTRGGRERGDRARIETAAQCNADRNVSPGDQLRRLFQLLADQRGRVTAQRRSILHAPVASLALGPGVEIDGQQMRCG